jgi:hypothetical protein
MAGETELAVFERNHGSAHAAEVYVALWLGTVDPEGRLQGVAEEPFGRRSDLGSLGTIGNGGDKQRPIIERDRMVRRGGVRQIDPDKPLRMRLGLEGFD